MKLSTDNLPADDRAATSLLPQSKWEELFFAEDRQIAAFKGHTVSAVMDTRDRNGLLWEQWRGQMQAADTPSARRRARQEPSAGAQRKSKNLDAQPDFDCPIPRPGPVSRAGLALLNWLCSDRVMLWFIVLLTAYMALTQFCPGWLAEVVGWWKGY